MKLILDQIDQETLNSSTLSQSYAMKEISKSLEIIFASLSTEVGFDAAALFINECFFKIKTSNETTGKSTYKPTYKTNDLQTYWHSYDHDYGENWQLFWEKNLSVTDMHQAERLQHRNDFAQLAQEDSQVLSIPAINLMNSPALQFAPSESRSALSIPLRKEGISLGLLVFYKVEAHGFGNHHINQTNAYVPLLTMILQNAEEATQCISSISSQSNSKVILNANTSDERQALSAISTELKKAETADELAIIFLRETAALANSLGSTIYRADQTEATLKRWKSYPSREEAEQVFRIDEGLLGIVARGKEPLLYHWEQSAVGYQQQSHEAEKLGIQYGAVLLPMCTSQGKLVGVLIVHLDENQQLVPDVIPILQSIATMAADVLNRASTRDILEQLVVERTQELRDANEQLLELDRLKNKFIHDMSHEFRTPLTSIGLYLNLLEKVTPEAGDGYIDALKRQTAQLSRLVNAILDVSAPAQMAKLGEFDQLDLTAVIDELVETQMPYTETNGLTLHWDASESIHVNGNMDALRRLVSHLIDNAINYTQEGTIHVSLTTQDKQVCICVEDTGLGIPKDDLAHIFDRFYRGSQVSQLSLPGCGLGLSMVKQIAQQHHGHVEVESKPEKGTTFRVWLPLAEEELSQ